LGKGRALIAALLIAAVLAPLPASEAAPAATTILYRVLDLGFLPGTDSAIPWAINATGAVVGSAGVPYRAFLWTAEDGMVELPCPFTNCVARDLNDRGQAVGSGWNETLEWPGKAIRWTNGTAEILGTLPGATTSEAFAINATGVVVGGSPSPGAALSPRAFLFRDDTGMVPLFNASGNHAYDINDAGQVVGYYAAGDYHAFRWSDGVLEDLGVLPNFARSFGFAVNSVGQVAGSSSTATGNSEHVIRYTDGIGLEDLGGGGETNKGWGINRSGAVVGQGRPGGGLLRAFLYTDVDGLQDLRNLIENPADWFLYLATDINDAGQIVVHAFSNIDTKWHAVRLDPRPDTTPPVTTASYQGTPGDAGWWRSAVNVSLTASDESGVASTSYRIDGGAWQTYGAPFPITGDGAHRLEFYSVDVWGNVEPAQNGSLSIDTMPPTTSHSVSGTPGDAGWWRSAVNVSLTSTDGTSGVRQTLYRVDSGALGTYLGPFEVSGDGRHLVEYAATDNAGNVEALKSLAIDIDTTPPTLDVTMAGTRGNAGWWVGDVTITLMASDTGSGGTALAYRIDGGPELVYGGPFLVTGDGDHTVDYRATDAAGNTAASSVAVRIDGTPPEASVLLTGTLGGGGWYLTEVTVEIAAADALSGIARVRYSLDANLATDYTGPFLVSSEGMHTVDVVVEDVSGNLRTEAATFGIDESPPMTALGLSGTQGNAGWWSSEVAIVLSANDASSGVAGTWYALNGGAPQIYTAPFTVSQDGVLLLTYWSTDEAGNAEPPTSAEVRMDRTPPQTTIDLSPLPEPSGWIRGPVQVVLSAQDRGSGVAFVRYRLDGGPLSDYTGPFSISLDGAHLLEVVSEDIAGNEEALKSMDVRLDATPPALVLLHPVSGGVLTTADVVVNWSATDATSGLAGCHVSLDGGAQQVPLGTSYTFLGVAEGIHTVRIHCVDVAGNTAEASSTFTVRTATATGSTPAGLSPLAVGVIVLAAVGAAAALAVLLRRRVRGNG